MRRKLGVATAALIALAGMLALYGYDRVSRLESEALTESVHALYGAGGNVAVLRTERGAVVVDTLRFPFQGRHIREMAERLGGGPTQLLINTHHHADHTHGNLAWAAGTRVLATPSARAALERFDAAFWQGSASGVVPGELVDGQRELRIGGKTIRLYALGRGHTAGDLVVLFVEDRVLHAGDLFFNGVYPSVDLEAGGSIQEWAATLERVLALDFERAIPGHGRASDRAGVIAFQRFVAELADYARRSVAAGISFDETIARADLASGAQLEALRVPLLLDFDRESALRGAWREARDLADAAATSAGGR
ncbi:MAG TPA: MBL fold metallo-hydrolase [Myxococcota bacterium]|nr:MBL fold metallo-hydrolase [Myxococcota bacterium]